MEIIAHRGLHNTCPENSFAAIKQAVDNNISAIEIDVRKCKTGEVVLFHDRNLKAKAGYNKYVIKTTFNTISKLQLKSGGSAHKIPDLRKVFSEFGADLNYVLDIKKETWINDGLEENLISLVQEFGLMDKVIFSSFNHYSAKRVARFAPEARVGLILVHPFQIKLFNIDPFTSLHVDYRHLSKLNIKQIKNSGKKIYVWTLNDGEICKDIVSKYPIDGIISDNPLEIKRVLAAE